MDPNTTLKEIRSRVKEVLGDTDNNTLAALQLAEAIEDLDQWMSKGGFKPAAWVPNDPVLDALADPDVR